MVDKYNMTRLQKASYYILHQPYGAKSFKDSDKHPAIEGYTYSEGDTFYIVFRASSTFMDYVVNFQLPKTRLEHDKPYTAHGGYVRRYTRIHNEIMTRYLLSGCNKVHIIGYSMGASVALISAYYFSKIVKPQVTCFEPLAVCSRKLSQLLTGSCDIWYTVYGSDIVTKLLFWNYHAGRRIEFGKKKWCWSIKDHPFENIMRSLDIWGKRQQ